MSLALEGVSSTRHAKVTESQRNGCDESHALAVGWALATKANPLLARSESRPWKILGHGCSSHSIYAKQCEYEGSEHQEKFETIHSQEMDPSNTTRMVAKIGSKTVTTATSK